MSHPLAIALMLLAIAGVLPTLILAMAIGMGVAGVLLFGQRRRMERERVGVAWWRAKLGYGTATSRDEFLNNERRRALGYD